MRIFFCLSIFLFLLASSANAAPPSIAGCSVFPADNIWNVPIDTLPLNSNSDAYVSSIGSTNRVHPDFGSGLYNGGPIGIPFVVVDSTQARVNVSFEYSDESDPGPYPVPANAPIEGGSGSSGDRHVLVLDRSVCMLYELYSSYPQPGGSWMAGSGAVFNLNSNALRPLGWTSADAAGLPILPGLVRYDEVASGEITHALRFTAPRTQRSFLWPGRHFASSSSNPALPPMGARFRLKANFNISAFSPANQVILRALKKYGMFLADNGSSWYLSGVPDERWDNDELRELGDLRGSDFEVVDESTLQQSADSAQVRGGSTPPSQRIAKSDFDGDGISDIVVWRPNSGYWFVLPSGSGFDYAQHRNYQHGLPGDIPLAADVDGDGRADLLVWRPSNATFYLRLSGEGYSQLTAYQWGLAGDIPLAADYDGDSRADLAVYRPANGTFYVLRSSAGFNRTQALRNNPNSIIVVLLGGYGHDLVVGDINGDRAAEFVVVWQQIRFWTVKDSANRVLWSLPWGMPGDTPRLCDWNGNGRDDRVVLRPNAEELFDWFVATDTGPVFTKTFGSSRGVSNCNRDYNGDGALDLSSFLDGHWTIGQTGSNEVQSFDFGLPGDIPL